MDKTIFMNEALYQYWCNITIDLSPAAQALHEATLKISQRKIKIPREQGQLMQMLLRIMRAEKVLEIGTFTGFSALMMAEALGHEGRLITCDVSEETTQMAMPFWQQAGVDHKIQLHIKKGLDLMRELHAQDQTFDFIFIDADKEQVKAYYELAYELTRTGGLIAIDNTFWSGRVIDENETTPSTIALRKFNEYLHSDTRVYVNLIPIGDGLTLALKK